MRGGKDITSIALYTSLQIDLLKYPSPPHLIEHLSPPPRSPYNPTTMFSTTLRRSFAARPTYASRQFLAARQFQTSSRCLARKDAQDKDSLKPESNEYSKSGSDDKSAAVDDAAFNPDKTSPEEEHDTAGAETKGKDVYIYRTLALNREMSVVWA